MSNVLLSFSVAPESGPFLSGFTSSLSDWLGLSPLVSLPPPSRYWVISAAIAGPWSFLLSLSPAYLEESEEPSRASEGEREC